jgi:hypothetical protein
MPIVVLILLLAGLGACDRGAAGATAQAELATRRQNFQERLAAARAGVPDEPVARWELPAMLAEISGLAITPDGRLLAHGDETGEVFEIDYRTGLVVKRFGIGDPPVTDDFESIALHDTTITLVTSSARLYQFAEGANGARVPYTSRDLALDDGCHEFEGAVFSPDGGTLTLACKARRGKGADGLLLYRIAVGDGAPGGLERIEVGRKKFSPSDITIRPDNGNYLLIAGPQQGYLELTPAGAVVVARALPKRHPQAEGLAVTRDGLLLIADEAASGRASLTVYAAPFR